MYFFYSTGVIYHGKEMEIHIKSVHYLKKFSKEYDIIFQDKTINIANLIHDVKIEIISKLL